MNLDIKKILLNINFADKYKEMVDEFPDNDNRLDSYSIACVSDIIKSLKKHIDGLMRCRKTKEAKLYAGIVTSYEGFYNSEKVK